MARRQTKKAATARNRRPKKRGRPTKYLPKFAVTAKLLCEQGATDLEVADALGIGRTTFYQWLAKHAAFREAVKLGKEPADDRVERALFHRAVGYEHDAVKIFNHNGEPVVVPYREHVPPDSGAAMNWLKNRRGDKWKDTKALTGADGGPLELHSVIEFVDAVADQSSPVPG